MSNQHKSIVYYRMAEVDSSNLTEVFGLTQHNADQTVEDKRRVEWMCLHARSMMVGDLVFVVPESQVYVCERHGWSRI